LKVRDRRGIELRRRREFAMFGVHEAFPTRPHFAHTVGPTRFSAHGNNVVVI
jgi:hypothetical protein